MFFKSNIFNQFKYVKDCEIYINVLFNTSVYHFKLEITIIFLFYHFR